MTLYYFDMVDGIKVKDPEGRYFEDNLDVLRQEALADAREIIADAALSGLNVTKRRFEIRIASGEIVLIVEFADALVDETHIADAHHSTMRH